MNLARTVPEKAAAPSSEPQPPQSAPTEVKEPQPPESKPATTSTTAEPASKAARCAASPVGRAPHLLFFLFAVFGFALRRRS